MTKVACIQMDISFGDPVKNRETVTKAFQKLFREEKVDVVVLPELWTTGYDLSRIHEIGDKDGREVDSFLSTLAKTYSTNIVGGSFANITDDGVLNTLRVYDSKGTIIHEYSKVHLFQLMNEHQYLTPGSEGGNFSLSNFKSAVSICYDIRFPEWIRKSVLNGAEVVYVVAEWPDERLHHWKTILTARAIENQCYIVACNRVGSDPATLFGGHSMVIDPWGKIVAEASQQEEVLLAKIYPEKVKEIRSRIPIFQDRRENLY
ncbi:hydrolase [Bacillus coahuilensis m2-6]|uniref:carbon-nitrogen family hydrolase n=1 Tax=Bacillus coahuilensis TaxID=408580 RepID=UPI0001850B77|nr:carbon-nitrogen family hydrolase [Bacillus coahuilensis]KUP09501.1 hydrolase [Bacillus coahuilensis m2-6]